MGIALSIIGILATAAFSIGGYLDTHGRGEAAYWYYVAGVILSCASIPLALLYAVRKRRGRQPEAKSVAPLLSVKTAAAVPVSLRKPFEPVSIPGSGLSEEEIYVLRALSDPRCESYEDKVASFLGLNPARVKFYLTELEGKGYVSVLSTYLGTNKATYGLTQKARMFLVQNNLI